ncbi:hypothetical protein [Ruegeria meonggei]|uniref:Uncharacterized protein n=1 Tax=Ruegeria meonggei TaxID=1446476 RepID=A0A1X6ZNB9_9RHOB|nr:hypothetical protein [Ruegeria meonggei]SLN56777.1 hypothetical protein RUM8411_02769 [Ruegeria meonggei]
MAAFGLVYLPTGLTVFSVFLATVKMGVSVYTVGFAVLLLSYVVLFFLVVKALWKPIEKEKLKIEREFSEQGLRIFRVKNLKFDIAKAEG